MHYTTLTCDECYLAREKGWAEDALPKWRRCVALRHRRRRGGREGEWWGVRWTNRG